jgi:hypothetical protein
LCADVDAGPFLDHPCDGREIGIGAEFGVGYGEHLANRRAHHHRHAERFRFVGAKPYILVGKTGCKAEIKRPRQDRARELVLRRAVAAAARIDDVDHHLRIEAGLDAHHDRFRRDNQSGGGKKVVAELCHLGEPGLFARIEELAEDLQYGLDFGKGCLRTGQHHGQCAALRACDAAADRRIHPGDHPVGKPFGHDRGNSRTGGRKINDGLDPVPVRNAVLAEHHGLNDRRRRQADQDDLALRGDIRGRLRSRCAARDQRLQCVRIGVEDAKRMAGVDEPPCHGAAHPPDPNEPKLLTHSSSSLAAGLVWPCSGSV